MEKLGISPTHLVIPSNMDRTRRVLEGLLAGTKLATILGADDLAFAVPQAGTLQGVISQVLGQRRTAELVRGSTDLQGIRLRLATRRKPMAHPTPILACFTDISLTASLARAASTTGMVYVPWALEEQDAFLAAFAGAVLHPNIEDGTPDR